MTLRFSKNEGPSHEQGLQRLDHQYSFLPPQIQKLVHQRIEILCSQHLLMPIPLKYGIVKAMRSNPSLISRLQSIKDLTPMYPIPHSQFQIIALPLFCSLSTYTSSIITPSHSYIHTYILFTIFRALMIKHLFFKFIHLSIISYIHQKSFHSHPFHLERTSERASNISY